MVTDAGVRRHPSARWFRGTDAPRQGRRPRGQRLLPPPKNTSNTPRRIDWPAFEVATLPAVRIDVSSMRWRWRSASLGGLHLRLALALGGPLGGRELPRPLLDLALLLGRASSSRARRRSSARRRRASWPPRRPSRRPPSRCEPRRDDLVGALRVDAPGCSGRRACDAATDGRDLLGRQRRHPRVGRDEPGRGERRRDALGREDGDERLADAQRGDRPLDVVVLGHREGPRGLAQRVGVVGRERPQRVLDAVAELAEHGRRARRSAPGSRSTRRRPWTGSAAPSARSAPSAPSTRR